MRKRTGVIAVVMLFAACSGGRAPEPKPRKVRVEEDPVRIGVRTAEHDYTITSGDCRITWTVFQTSANRGVIRHRADCRLPLEQQAPLIEKVLRKVLVWEETAREFRTLSWDRLYPDGAETGNQDVTMALRLALAAAKSPEWDSVKGAPRGGDVNGWVRKIANEALIYRELIPVFQAAGLEFRLGSVEKVLVLPAGKLVFFDELRKSGVRAKDKLPFDCQTWFSVRRAGG